MDGQRKAQYPLPIQCKKTQGRRLLCLELAGLDMWAFM